MTQLSAPLRYLRSRALPSRTLAPYLSRSIARAAPVRGAPLPSRSIQASSRPFSSTIAARAESGAAASGEDGEKRIYDLLKARFEPKQLQVQDVSGGCGSFYAITISSKAFAGVPMVKAHRLVQEELKEIIENIHGLQLKTLAETE